MGPLATGLEGRLAMDANLGGLRAAASANPRDGIRAVARQFEAMLVGQLMQQARQSQLSEDSLAGQSGRLYLQLLDQQLAQKVAAAGTGLAPLIEAQLLRNLPESPSANLPNRRNEG